MHAIKVRERIEAHEELTSISSWSRIGHRKDSRSGMLVVKVLVSELSAVDGLSPGSICFSEISTLGHEARYDSVEATAFEV